MQLDNGGGAISPFVRGVAGVLGGVLMVGAVLMFAAVLPPLVTGHPPSFWTAFAFLGGGLGGVQVGRVFLRAAVTGVSPRWERMLKP